MTNPAHNPVSFAAFAHAMMQGDLSEVNRYYDEDGDEVDLTNTFAGNDQPEAGSDDDNETMVDSDSVGGNVNNDQDEATELQDPAQDLIDHTLAALEDLSLLAQPVVNEQPLSTQTVLAQQATDIFKSYAEHGSKARLSAGIMKFLQGGDTVRVKGHSGKDPKKDRRLRIAPKVPARKTSQGYGDGDDAQDALRPPTTKGGEKATVGDREQMKGRDEVMATDQTSNSSAPNTRTVQPNGDGQCFDTTTHTQKRSTSNESWNSGSTLVSQNAQADNAVVANPNAPLAYALPTDTQPSNERPVLGSRQTSPRKPSAPPTYLDKISASLKIANAHKVLEPHPFTPYTISTPHRPKPPTNPQSFTPAQLKHNASLPSSYSLTTDHETNSLLPETPFAPLGVNFAVPTAPYFDPATNTWRKVQFPPDFIDALNKIYKLSNAHARFLLSYFTHRYAPGPALGVPEVDEHGKNVEPPHALFRLGITHYLQSRVEGIVRSADDDEDGLGPEERDFLRGVFERIGVTEVCVRAVGESRRAKRANGGGGRMDVDEEDEDRYEDVDDEDDDDEIMDWDDEVDEEVHYNEHVPISKAENSNGGQSDQAENIGGAAPTTQHEPSGVTAAAPTTQTPFKTGSFLNYIVSLAKQNPDILKEPTMAEDLIDGLVYVDTGLNVVEKEILARAVDTDVETIQRFWEDMRHKRKAWGALRSWCKMMDGRRVRIAKANGTW